MLTVMMATIPSMAVFFFFLHGYSPMSLLSDLNTGPKVFHSKIPQEIKNSKILFRKKIPVVDSSTKHIAKIEKGLSNEKKAVPSQQNLTPPEQREQMQKTDLRQPVESPESNGKTPQLAKAIPSQPIFRLPEQRDPERETGLYQPLESPLKNETTHSWRKQGYLRQLSHNLEKANRTRRPNLTRPQNCN